MKRRELSGYSKTQSYRVIQKRNDKSSAKNIHGRPREVKECIKVTHHVSLNDPVAGRSKYTRVVGYSNAYITLTQRPGIVETVADHRYDMTLRLEITDVVKFVLW